MPATALSFRLYSSVGAEFFRPLAKPSAPIYVDCADRLVLEAGEAGRLTQKETVEIIREVLALHPLVTLMADLEEDIFQATGRRITIADEKAMSRFMSVWARQHRAP